MALRLVRVCGSPRRILQDLGPRFGLGCLLTWHQLSAPKPGECTTQTTIHAVSPEWSLGSVIHPRKKNLEESELWRFERQVCGGTGLVIEAGTCNSLTASRPGVILV